MRRDAMIAGVFDPGRRLDRDRLRPLLEHALAPFGAVEVEDAGPLVAAIATPAGEAAPLARAPALSMLDGYLEAETEIRDAGALAAAWSSAGDAVLPRLRGAFAALLWDAESGRGSLVRDQLGQRPAFLAERGPVLYFASELRPLLELLPERPGPDPVAVARFLAPTDLRENRLLYEGVSRLPGGHLVRLEGDSWAIERWWAPRYEPPLAGSPEELVDETRAQLAAAVRRTLGDSEQAAILLSGGLDSTSVAALAAPELRRRDGELTAYSDVFPTHDTIDESKEIAAVVERLELPAVQQSVRGGSLLAAGLEHLEAFAYPEISPNGFFSRPLLRRAASDGMEVVLTGEGGDNVFGAPLYLIADRLARGRLLAALQLVQRFPNVAYHPWRSVRLRLLRDFGLLPLLPERLQTRRALRGEQLPAFLNERATALLAGGASARPWHGLDGPRWWAEKADHFARRVVALGAPEITTREARLGGVTERHPLLSLDLVQFALRLPPEQQFDAERNRPALRRAMQGLLPDEVRLRSHKITFDAMRGQSLQSDYDVVRRLLTAPDARIREYTRPGAIADLLEHSPGRWGELSVWSGQLTRLLAVECWLRQLEDPGFARGLRESGELTPARLELALFPPSTFFPLDRPSGRA